MSVFLPPWPPQNTGDIAIYALLVATLSFLVSGFGLLLNAVTIAVAEFRRLERIKISANLRYRVNLERDRYLFPTVVTHHSLHTGDRCCLLKITYHGRHSVHLGNIYREIDRAGLHSIEPAAQPRTLYDGQTRYALFAEGMFSFDNLTAFVIETESHGNRIKRVRPWRHFVLWMHQKWPWGFRNYDAMMRRLHRRK